MLINKTNTSLISFQAVKLNAFLPPSNSHDGNEFFVEFTDEDIPSAVKIFRLEPEKAGKNLHVQVFTNDKGSIGFEYDMADKCKRNPFISHKKGEAKGSKKFAALRNLIQKIEPGGGYEDTQENLEKGIKVLKAFFKQN